MVKKISARFYMILMFIFLYSPIVTLIVLSFNRSKSRSKWGGFTLTWYQELFHNEQIMNALYTTLIIAFTSALIATILGTAAAIAMNSMKKMPSAILMSITNIPMLNADIVTGISLMLLFIAFHYTLGFSSVLMAHITFNIPYVILSVMPKLKQTNKSTFEAALDLGATPLFAFYKVILPDIFPGVLSGFLLSFTMSLDDFVITHFTKGPGINTLSTKIYTEVRKGIKPEMYALSTLLFMTVFILLILINKKPVKKKKLDSKIKWKGKAKLILVFILLALASFGIFVSFGKNYSFKNNQIVVYNWGEYIDPDVVEQFTEETGIQVVYEEFETNEDMYPKIKTGAVSYDVVCPSDYMIQRMIQEGLLAEIDFNKVPNIKNIDQLYLDSSKGFDPENKYSVPYCWGTLGILYNKTMVDEPIDSWSAIFDKKYKDNILMINSVRDAFGIALKYLGYSLNSTNEAELEEAKALLKDQSDLVQAYVVDQVRDKMIGGEAALGVIYSGEANFTQKENKDLVYVVPKEGSNIWIDSWVIPKNCKNKEGAEAFINFLCRADIALKNFEYITYSTPNAAAKALLDEDLQNNKVAFPDASILENCETYNFLGDDVDAIYNEKWHEVKSN